MIRAPAWCFEVAVAENQNGESGRPKTWSDSNTAACSPSKIAQDQDQAMIQDPSPGVSTQYQARSDVSKAAHCVAKVD